MPSLQSDSAAKAAARFAGINPPTRPIAHRQVRLPMRIDADGHRVAVPPVERRAAVAEPMARYRIEWLLLGIALLILGTLIGYSSHTDRGRLEARERDRLQVQGRVIDENLGRQLQGVNNALAGVLNDLQDWDGKSVGLPASRRLKVLSGAMPGVRTMNIVDAQGTVLASNRNELIGQSASQRDYFKVPRKHPDPALLYVTAPFMTTLGVVTINLVRVVTGPSGEFAGIVSATLDPAYFTVLLRSVLYAPDMRTSITHWDGKAFLFVPPTNRAPGMDLAKPGFFFTRHRESGQAATVMTGTVKATGEERMMALRTFNDADLRMDKPLVIAVSRDLSAVFSSWRTQTIRRSAFYAALALTAIISLYFAQSRRRMLDRVAAAREHERRESAERLKLALGGADLGLWDRHLPSGKVSFNERRCEMLGYGIDEIESDCSSWQALVHPDDLPVLHAALDAHLQGETPAYESAYRMRHKDGHWVWILDRGKVMERDSAGAPVRMVGTHMDITERMRVQEALKDSEARYRCLSELSSDWHWEQDENFRYSKVCSSALHRYGTTSDVLIGKTRWEWPSVGVSAEQWAAHRADLEAHRPFRDFEVGRFDRDGRRIYVTISGAPAFDSQGRFRGYRGVAMEITERKRAEQFLRLQNAALDAAANAIVIIDAAGVIRWVNSAFTSLTGYTREEALGRTQSMLLRSGTHDEPFYKNMWDTILSGRVWSGEIVDRRKDGSLYTEETTITPVRDEAGDIVRFIAIKQDISERKRSEERAQDAYEQLRILAARLNNVREEETAMLAREIHDELGQELTGLKMDLSWIASRLSADQPVLKEKANWALKHIDASIDTVRNIAARLRPAILDHLGLVAAIEWQAQNFQNKSGIDCEVISNKSPIELKPDQTIALYRIVQEAMTNVARHADASRIDVSLYEEGALLTLEVRDNGKGIGPDAAAGYTSIGLLGMRERALAAGGQFAIEGFPGKGTVVSVQMPLCLQQEAA